MGYVLRRYANLSTVLAATMFFMVACASISTPEGGDYDYDPPKVVRSNPGFNATNVAHRKINIYFDENVTLENQSEKIIITPPQQNFPNIQTVNRRVSIELRDSLIPNTTYTIDFTDAVVDNNEKNALENFSFSFSTGDVVDTLAVSGKILSAENLEPVKGIYVGLHSNLEDSAFVKTKFLRISRTNDYGAFTIRGIAPGKYKIYALDDANRDYMYDNPSEAIAFSEVIIEPSVMRDSRTDTITHKVGKTTIDTMKLIQFNRFIPDDIMLRSFKSDFQRQYLVKDERVSNKLKMIFSAKHPMPQLEPLSFDKSIDWAIIEKSRYNDTLTYWIKDKTIEAIDTLSFQVRYMKTDSLNQSVLFTDTLNFIDRVAAKRKQVEQARKKKEEKKKKEDDEEDATIFMKVDHSLSSTQDVYKDISFEFSEPLAGDSLQNTIKLQSVVDSTFTDLSYQLLQDSLNPRKYTLQHKWNYGKNYRVLVDSASIYSIYGLWNNKIDQKFQVKEEDQYSHLAIEVSELGDSVQAFVELLDKSDKPIRKSTVKNRVAVFKFVNPGEYYARVVIDSNGNGQWDTGNYDKHLQPEEVYYYPGSIEVKFNWEHTIDNWTNIKGRPLDKQKPLEIIKNKPQEKDSKKKQMEQRDKKTQQQQQQNQNPNQQQNSNQNRNPNQPTISSGGVPLSY